MENILNFFQTNSIWFIVGVIIILLALIGRYADKTNFGQNKNGEKPIDEQKDDAINDINDSIVNNDINKTEQIEIEQTIKENSVSEIEIEKKHEKNINEIVNEEPTKIDEQPKEDIVQNEYDKLDKELDILLPKKDIIDEDLLEDIDNLSLDKTQKIKITDIPDLDDVDLPEIKNLNQQDEDIWKF